MCRVAMLCWWFQPYRLVAAFCNVVALHSPFPLVIFAKGDASRDVNGVITGTDPVNFDMVYVWRRVHLAPLQARADQDKNSWRAKVMKELRDARLNSDIPLVALIRFCSTNAQ